MDRERTDDLDLVVQGELARDEVLRHLVGGDGCCGDERKRQPLRASAESERSATETAVFAATALVSCGRACVVGDELGQPRSSTAAVDAIGRVRDRLEAIVLDQLAARHAGAVGSRVDPFECGVAAST